MIGASFGVCSVKTDALKPKIVLATAVSLLLNFLLPQPVTADANSGDLERLYWLCSDYQLPVKGYVVEGWFALPCRPGLQKQLEQQLQLTIGQQQGNLTDGSALNRSLSRKGQKYYIELQLITEHLDTARHFYELWQSFADWHQLKNPIGVTVIAELPEVLDNDAMQYLTEEIQQSLQLAQSNTESAAPTLQVSGYSPQFSRGLEIGGQTINFNMAFARRAHKTALYLATPVIYQQY